MWWTNNACGQFNFCWEQNFVLSCIAWLFPQGRLSMDLSIKTNTWTVCMHEMCTFCALVLCLVLKLRIFLTEPENLLVHVLFPRFSTVWLHALAVDSLALPSVPLNKGLRASAWVTYKVLDMLSPQSPSQPTQSWASLCRDPFDSCGPHKDFCLQE